LDSGRRLLVVGPGLPAQRAGHGVAVRLWHGRRGAAAAHAAAAGLAGLGARGADGHAGGADPGAAPDFVQFWQSQHRRAASERGAAADGAVRD